MKRGVVQVGDFRFAYRFGIPYFLATHDFDITLERRIHFGDIFRYWKGLWCHSGSMAEGWAPLEPHDVENIYEWLWDNADWLKDKEGLGLELALELTMKLEERLTELDERLRARGKIGLFVRPSAGTI